MTLDNIVCGIIAGIFSAIFLWIIKPKPHIKICKQIAWKSNKNDYDKKEYRLKIINKSLYNAYDFKVNIRILCRGCYLNIDGPNVILLKNRFYYLLKRRNIAEGEITFERTILIKVHDASREAMTKLLDKLKDESIQDKYDKNELTLHDLIKKDNNLHIDVILVATSSASGVKRCFIKRLDNNIIEGAWQYGKSKVTPIEIKNQTP